MLLFENDFQQICDALRDLVSLEQFKKRDKKKHKNTHGEVLLLVKVQAKA